MSTTTAAGPADAAGLTRRQAELLDQLEALFLAEGFARFTLDDLAVRLRCSKSTLYTLAGSKEQLAHRVVKHFFRKATDAVEAQTGQETDPGLRVVAYLSAVARALAPAGAAFHRDLDAFPPGRETYERNTALARIAAGSEPACASDRQYAPRSRPPISSGRRSRRCVSLPKEATGKQERVCTLMPRATLAHRAASSSRTCR